MIGREITKECQLGKDLNCTRNVDKFIKNTLLVCSRQYVRKFNKYTEVQVQSDCGSYVIPFSFSIF